jgi:Family of unknown function (DUF5670)
MPPYVLDVFVFILLVMWLMGWLVWPAGPWIHLLLVLVLGVVAARIVRSKAPAAPPAKPTA